MDPSTIEIRPLATHAERQACVELQRSTWGEAFSDVVPVSILKVVTTHRRRRARRVRAAKATCSASCSGSRASSAGGSFTGPTCSPFVPRRETSGSADGSKNNSGIRPRARRDVIYWTFDPLVARNAHLNFNRLGVRLAEYVDDMYGITDSVLHGGMATDRIDRCLADAR